MHKVASLSGETISALNRHTNHYHNYQSLSRPPPTRPPWSHYRAPVFAPIIASQDMLSDLQLRSARFVRSPFVLFLSFATFSFTLVWTLPQLAPYFLSFLLLLIASHHFILSPSRVDYGDQRRVLLQQEGERADMLLPAHIRHSEQYMINSRGQLLYTQQWQLEQAQQPPRALVLMLHGYGDYSSGSKQGLAHTLADEGYLAAALDFPGHGRSDGLHVDIPSFEPMVDDCLQYIDALRGANPALPLILFAESMGGAIAFLLSTHPRLASCVAGVVFLAPMVQISPKMHPPAFLVRMLLLLMRLGPHLPLTLVPDVSTMVFRDPAMLARVRTCAIYYHRLPRLSTAANMLFSSLSLAERLHELRVPFIICQGAGDKVVDPAMSQRMYDMACSADKTLKMYEGAWHSLLTGEEEHTMQRVRADIREWMTARTGGCVGGMEDCKGREGSTHMSNCELQCAPCGSV